jgi:hypothetical protein
MNHRYKIRMYESGDSDGDLAAGTIVLPIDRAFSLQAISADEIEGTLRKEVLDGKLAGGRIYQICPEIGNLEVIRAVAISENANAQRVILEAAKGMYSEFRRIRYMDTGGGREEPMALPEAVPA